MKVYVLAPGAQRDLTVIRDYFEEAGGYRVARRIVTQMVAAFRFLARTPGAGHKRTDLAGGRPVLFWPMREYLVVYRRGPRIENVAVLHGNRDVARIIEQRMR
ncbi:MAG: type II toxin-antitoxin system RelE/ParE family toxin [Bryobacteraceae bacterium]